MFRLSEAEIRQYFEERLERLTSAGDHYRALCPFHADKTPSLSIRKASGFTKCFAGCFKDGRFGGLNIFDFEMKFSRVNYNGAVDNVGCIVGRNLRGNNLHGRSVPRQENTSSKSFFDLAPLVERYHLNLLAHPEALAHLKGLRGYTDETIRCFQLGYNTDKCHAKYVIPIYENGKPVLLKLYQPGATKEFKWSRFPRGVNSPLFPDVPDAEEVILFEGEPDTLLARQMGLPAVTGTAGAGTWKQEWAPQLKGKVVVIVYDQDHAGQKGVVTVAKSVAPFAEKVKIVNLPVRTPHKDFSDWVLEEGGTAEKLKQLIQQSRPFVAPTENDAQLGHVENLWVSGTSEVIAQLSGLDPVSYDKQRLAAAKCLGIRISTLDAEVAKLREVKEVTEQGIPFTDPDPWEEAVDGVVVLDAAAALIAKYVALPDHGAVALALWVVHCHCFECFPITPRIAFTSPAMRCGKSTALSILSLLAPRPLIAANTSAAAFFRIISKFKPTIFLDELDQYLSQKSDGAGELRAILNAGHNRATAFVPRVNKDSMEPEIFPCFAPVALGGIGRLPATLADRSISIPMTRKRKSDSIDRLRLDRPPQEFETLRRKFARWTKDHQDHLSSADPSIPDYLNDRQQDNWRVLISLADEAAGHWPTLARNAAMALSTSAEDDSFGNLLLEDLQRMFMVEEKLPSTEIVKKLAELEERPWPEWKRGQSITVRQLAKILKPFHIVSKTIRMGYGIARGYDRQQFDDVFARYVSVSPPGSVTTLQPSVGAGLGQNKSVTLNTDVTDKNRLKPRTGAGCNTVTHKNGSESHWGNV